MYVQLRRNNIIIYPLPLFIVIYFFVHILYCYKMEIFFIIITLINNNKW